MGTFVKGDVVVIPFPFSDLSNVKRRPALVLTKLKGDDVILCQITSIEKSDGYSIQLDDTDFVSGSLKKKSNIRPNRLFTAESNIIIYSAGKLSQTKIKNITNKVINIIRS